MLHTLFEKVAAAIAGIAVALSTVLAPVSLTEETPVGAQLPQAVAVFETSLAAPITAAATTMTLVSNSVRGGGSLSGYNCFTIDEGSAQAEFVCGTVSGTSVTGMTRGISPSTGTSTIAALQFSHRRGASVKITDFPIIQIIKAQLSGEDTFEVPIKYVSTMSTSTIGQNSSNIANVAYVNSIAFNGAGVIDATLASRGVAELATGAEIAASTASGTTGVLVIPASLATSTYNSGTAANRVVVTGTGGTIDDDFLPRTIATSTTFTASTTFSQPPIGAVRVRYFTTSTSYSKPAGLNWAFIRVWGGGGSGASASTFSAEAAGGGGGGCVEAWVASTTLGTSETITIGAGGAAVSGDSNGNRGATSTFGSLMSAPPGGGGGGGGTLGASGGGGGGGIGTGGNANTVTAGVAGDTFASAGGNLATGTPALRGAGGGGTDNTIQRGQPGGASYECGGGGGGGAGSFAGGAGGTSAGGGAGGAGSNSTGAVNATSGVQPAGGGGARYTGGGGSGSSGAGGDGMVIIYEFF